MEKVAITVYENQQSFLFYFLRVKAISENTQEMPQSQSTAFSKYKSLRKQAYSNILKILPQKKKKKNK